MPRPRPRSEDLALDALLSRQAGLARRSQLRELGYGSDHVAAQISARRWQLVAPEVVSSDNGRLDSEQLLWRAVLHAPDACWVSHISALLHRGLERWTTAPVHVLTGRRQRPLALPGVVVHQSHRVPVEPPDLALGLPVVPVARAVIDAASSQPHPRLAAALVVACVQQSLATPAMLDSELAVCGRVRHKVRIREALRAAAAGSESVAEIDAEALVLRAGLPRPRRQVWVAGRRRDLVVDLPDGRLLVLEVDGPQHDDPLQRWRDADGDAALVALGHQLLRIPAYAVRPEAQRIVTHLREIWRQAGVRDRRPA
jgi:very-short-patch-repair endonuclease